MDTTSHLNACAGHGSTVIIGIGHPDRGDDAAGLLVADQLRGHVPGDVKVRLCSGEATQIMSAWECAAHAIVVDAVRSGQAPGTIHRFEDSAESPCAVFENLSSVRCSSHGLGLAEAVAMARVLERLPQHLQIYGIEAGSATGAFALGKQPCPAVQRAATEVCRHILQELQHA